MPKVNDEHFQKKRQQILDAAKRVCESKPLYSVTMKDIVLESGMSQGGVYKYYPNIDAVYVAILNEAARNSRVQADLESIRSAGHSPWQQLTELLGYVGSYVQDVVNNRGPIYFELMALYANEPARFLTVRDQLVEVSALELIHKQLNVLIRTGVADQTFVPLVPLEDLFRFMAASINGITQGLIAAHRLGGASTPDVGSLVGVLAQSVRLLLGEQRG